MNFDRMDKDTLIYLKDKKEKELKVCRIMQEKFFTKKPSNNSIVHDVMTEEGGKNQVKINILERELKWINELLLKTK